MAVCYIGLAKLFSHYYAKPDRGYLFGFARQLVYAVIFV